MVGVIHATVDASVGVVSASIRYPGTSDTIVQQETSRMKEYCKSTTCLRERERKKRVRILNPSKKKENACFKPN